ncbi:MAG TPA: hypothetical protein VJP88_04510 [Caulobacteraceae bacterium]|nr:hypothetical protein [Caulobacteraceae bacterium]
MRFSDVLEPPRGHFILEVRRKGIIVPELCMDRPNLIVNGSKQVHAKLLGGSVTNQSVTTIGYGTNGTAPTTGDTALTAAFTKAVDSTTYPASNQVQFAFSLASTEDNGAAIMEFGLLTAGGTLYARVTRSVALNKASDISFSGTWAINF